MRTKFATILICIFMLTGAAYAQKGQKAKPRIQEITVTLTEKGYQPEKIRLRRGIPARVTFVRKFEATCATEVIIQEYNIRRDLPMNQPVVVEFTPAKSGEIDFTCSMKMVGGKFTIM